jgi:hypothetical protein
VRHLSVDLIHNSRNAALETFSDVLFFQSRRSRSRRRRRCGLLRRAGRISALVRRAPLDGLLN